MFEVQLSLGHWLWSNYVALYVPLYCIRHTYFHVIGVQPPSLVTRSVAIFDMSGRHYVLGSNQQPMCEVRLLKGGSEV